MSDGYKPVSVLEYLQTNYKLEITLNDFSQRQWEEYQAELVNVSREKAQAIVTLVMSQKDDQANAVLNGAIVRAACKAGFLLGVPMKEAPKLVNGKETLVQEADIDELAPPAVTLMARAVRKHIEEVTQVPPE